MLGYEHRSYLSHLGAILSNASVVLLLLCTLGLLFILFFWMVPVLLLIAWFFALLFSVGLLLLSEAFRAFPAKAADSMETVGVIVDRVRMLLPYALCVGVLTCVLSIVLIPLDPSPCKSNWRVGLAVAVLLLLFMVGAIALADGGAQ